jgi:hypothetical protein
MKYIIILLSLFSFLTCSEKYKNEVLVKCNDNVDCSSVLKKYNFRNISKLTNTIYIIKLSDIKDAKDISKILQINKDIKFAHPNYIRIQKRR